MEDRTKILLGLAAAGAGTGLYVAKRRVRAARLAPDELATDEVWFDLDAVGVDVHTVPTHDGGELCVVEKGPADARPVVLLHGIVLQARVWGYQFRDLADRYRVVAVDLRGFGRSRCGEEGYGIDLLARDLATMLEQLDLRDAIVVGHSMGGMALMRFAANHPDVLDDRVAGLVFLATAPVVPLPAAIRNVLAATAPRGLALARRPGIDDRLPGLSLRPGDLSYALVRGVAFGRPAAPLHVELTRQLVAEAPRSATMGSGLGLHTHDAAESLRATRTPSLVIGGELDRITPVALSRRISECLPDNELHVLPGAGHMLMLERPTEVAGLIDSLVATVEARAGARA